MSVPGVQLGVPQGVPTKQPTGALDPAKIQQIMAQLQPLAKSVAFFARDSPILKNRKGLLNNSEDHDFFRYKRLIRCLMSEDYKKARAANPKNGMPEISNEKMANDFAKILVQTQLIIPVNKLHYKEIKQTNKKWVPNKQKPTLIKTKDFTFKPDDYYVWNYNKPSPYASIFGILLIVGIFTVILFPLWPPFMKRGVYWLSMMLMCLIGGIFVIAIIRLILYVITLIYGTPLWIFPNLFADVGFFESFVPFYEWEKVKKGKKAKKGSIELKEVE